MVILYQSRGAEKPSADYARNKDIVSSKKIPWLRPFKEKSEKNDI